jgi:hypothetical protein
MGNKRVVCRQGSLMPKVRKDSDNMKRHKRDKVVQIICHETFVPEHSCYVRFGTQKSVCGATTKYEVPKEWFITSRDEQMIFDFDRKGRVIGIELLGNKPCQKKMSYVWKYKKVKQ